MMTSAKFIGVHAPTALDYLIRESFLPPNPSESLYQWETYNDNSESGGIEELVTTNRCIVWSQGGVIYRVHRLQHEDQEIVQAVLTWFETDEQLSRPDKPSRANEPESGKSTFSLHRARTSLANNNDTKCDQRQHGRSRALVIIMKRQAHIYFQHGSNHIVNLPIEVECAFAAPTGLLLQRKIPQPQTMLASSPDLSVPPNSFNVSQRTVGPSPDSSEFLRAKRVQSYSPIDRNSEPMKLDSFLKIKPGQASAKSVPFLFTMTDPLLELGVVAELHEYSGHQSIPQPFNGEEKMLHVSLLDPSTLKADSSNKQCILLVTVNSAKQCYTIWCGFYLSPTPVWNNGYLRTLGQVSMDSTYGDNNATRFSFGDSTSADRRRSSRRGSVPKNLSAGVKGSRGKFERNSDTFRFDRTGNNGGDLGIVSDISSPAKKSAANRRTSSIVARAELSTQEANTYKNWPSNTLTGGSSMSFAGPLDNSFQLHKAGTTSPSENLQYAQRNPADHAEFMEVDDSEHAQFETSEIGPGLQELPKAISRSALDLIKKDLVLARVFDIPFSQISQDKNFGHGAGAQKENFGVFKTFSGDQNAICVSVLDRARNSLTEVYLHLHHLPNMPIEPLNSTWDNILTYLNQNSSIRTRRNVVDALKIVDKDVSALAILEKGENGSLKMILAPITPSRFDAGTAKEKPASFEKSGEATIIILQNDVDSSRSETSQGYHVDNILSSASDADGHILSALNSSSRKLQHAGALGEFDIVDRLGSCHQYQVRLRPREPFISRILNLSDFIMGDVCRRSLLHTWWKVHNTYFDMTPETEWAALVVTLFTLFVSDSDKSESQIEVPNQTLHRPYSLRASRSIAQNSAWNWILDEQGVAPTEQRTNKFLLQCATMARQYVQVSDDVQGRGCVPLNQRPEAFQIALSRLLSLLHLIYEEEKLNIISGPSRCLAPLLAQFGSWLGCSWANYYNSDVPLAEKWDLEGSLDGPLESSLLFQRPPSIHEWLKQATSFTDIVEEYPLASILSKTINRGASHDKTTKGPRQDYCENFTPRLRALTSLILDLCQRNGVNHNPSKLAQDKYLTFQYLETVPEALAARLRTYLSRLRASPPTTLPSMSLRDIGREDIELLEDRQFSPDVENLDRYVCARFTGNDVRSICSSNLEKPSRLDLRGPREIMKIFFREDTRSLEPTRLLCPQLVPIAVMHPPPAFSEAQFLEAQQNHAKLIYTRTMAIVSGQALLEYHCHKPLPTQKLDILLFNTSCRMQPSGITVNADRSSFVEEKVSWAFFHAGVQAGLRITSDTNDLDTSWLVLNKPADLGNRHAGLLLALGLNGHLRPLAKWLAFKYLTPKHDMTSIGLLLGWSASYFGSMDSLITRVLSVHLESLLPPGSAELNLNPMVQTAAIMGIGLLYYHSQHRRMSEKMLLEMEHVDAEAQAAPSTKFYRNEGYRLAAGFALGFINLGKGMSLSALRGLKLEERLIQLATGPCDVNIVHILDQATAGATIATALIFMKTHREDIAQKIGIPHTIRQFDSIRPDLLLLRVMARNLIMWRNILPTQQWIWESLPKDLQLGMRPVSLTNPNLDANVLDLMTTLPLSSRSISLYNILSGVCWSIALKHAGSGDTVARNCLISYYDKVTLFLRQLPQTYDENVTKNALMRFQHLLILAAATVMAGTGDILVLKRARVLHSSVSESSTFGFHQASHMAMGALFMGQGRFTFGTSNLAIASLVCAFYPIFPVEVLDNRAHLQAFRHFWVFAADARYILPRDVETNETIITPVEVVFRDGTSRTLIAPVLLPDLETIARIYTRSDEYWQVVLDFENNPRHLLSFRKHHTIFLRRKSLVTQHRNPFSIALAKRTEPRLTKYSDIEVFEWLFKLNSLASLGVGHTEVSSIFPRGRAEEERDKKRLFLIDEGKDPVLDAEEAPPVANLLDPRCTGIDDVLVLKEDIRGVHLDRLKGLSLLFDWFEKERDNRRKLTWEEWIGDEALEALRAALIKRMIKEGLVSSGAVSTEHGNIVQDVA